MVCKGFELGRMVGADEYTELWRRLGILSFNLLSGVTKLQLFLGDESCRIKTFVLWLQEKVNLPPKKSNFKSPFLSNVTLFQFRGRFECGKRRRRQFKVKNVSTRFNSNRRKKIQQKKTFQTFQHFRKRRRRRNWKRRNNNRESKHLRSLSLSFFLSFFLARTFFFQLSLLTKQLSVLSAVLAVSQIQLFHSRPN